MFVTFRSLAFLQHLCDPLRPLRLCGEVTPPAQVRASQRPASAGFPQSSRCRSGTPPFVVLISTRFGSYTWLYIGSLMAGLAAAAIATLFPRAQPHAPGQLKLA